MGLFQKLDAHLKENVGIPKNFTHSLNWEFKKHTFFVSNGKEDMRFQKRFDHFLLQKMGNPQFFNHFSLKKKKKRGIPNLCDKFVKFWFLKDKITAWEFPKFLTKIYSSSLEGVPLIPRMAQFSNHLIHWLTLAMKPASFPFTECQLQV